jgi:hypothetical protein
MWTQDFFELLRESTLNESHFADAIAFKEQHLPKRIYKYRADTDYARENLKSGTIWLASPDSYNDPYDCLLRFSAPNMTSAFERGLIDTFVTGLELQISAEKIKEAKGQRNTGGNATQECHGHWQDWCQSRSDRRALI